MKKKLLVGTCVGIVLIIGIFILLHAIKYNKKSESFPDLCWESVKNYEVSDLEDGTYMVSLTALDYKTIIANMTEVNEDMDVTPEKLMEIIHENEEVVKEYQFIVSSKTEDAIKAGYINEIGNDLTELILETYGGDTDEK